MGANEKMKINKVVCLMTSVRGGSKLLHSLMDSHPQVFCFPRTLQFNDFWNLIKSNNNSIQSIADNFIKEYPRFFSGKIWGDYNVLDKADKLGENHNETFSVDEDLFRFKFIELFANETDINSKSVFINVHIAYHEASGKTCLNNSIILYHIHALENIESLKFCVNDFGFKKIKLIFMSKHPLQGMRSIIKWMDNIGTPIQHQPAQLFYYQNEVYLGLDEIKREFPDLKIKILLLESMVKDNHEFMNSLTQWLNIKWNNSLLKPTIHGKLWWGNAKVPKKGIDNNSDKFEPEGFLEKKDWEFMKLSFTARMKEYGLVESHVNGMGIKIKVIAYTLLPTSYEWIIINRYFNRLLFSFNSFTNGSKKYFQNNILFVVKWFYFYIKRVFLQFEIYKNNFKNSQF